MAGVGDEGALVTGEAGGEGDREGGCDRIAPADRRDPIEDWEEWDEDDEVRRSGALVNVGTPLWDDPA